VGAEPGLRAALTEQELDAALEALADYTDLKSPYTIGHSRGVADLAAEAGRHYGLPAEDAIVLRRAALVHDRGRLGVSNSIWDKPAPWSAVERERVRLHPYLTERMLASSPALKPLAAIAAQHHERLDGSGYPSGLSGSALSPAARILAAADVYHAATEEHPHRPARAPLEAADELRAEVRAGRLDGAAAAAVLAAVGHRVGRRREAPAGLTSREIEVLRLLARGLSNRQIAERLVITRKTASSHIEHIYAKVGVSTRAAAGLFAVQHGLLPEERSGDPGKAEHAAVA
jgi:HD-GYP domain-containing protein (c-di-GMP phosphodiesterase class II)